MYHEQTTAMVRKHRRNVVVGIVCALALAVALVLAFLAVGANAQEQGAMTMRNSILDAAKECCAVEGSYPSSLSHLEQEYGLMINRDNYVITYTWVADNIMPSVVVVPR